MKNLFTLLFLSVLLVLSGCSTLTKQDGLPSMKQIDEWVANNQYGNALSSLEHISPSEKMFVAYVNKRKEVIKRAAAYEQKVLNSAQADIKKDQWAGAILSLNTALNNYPGSRKIHDKHNQVIKLQQKRIHKFDAKALLARAQLLYNKLPISKKEVANSPINLAAAWDLQSLENELSDMHTRLMAMTEQLVDDNEIELAEMCIKQARVLSHDKKSLSSIAVLENKINFLKKAQRDAALKKADEDKLRHRLEKKKKYSHRVKRLVTKVDRAIRENELIAAEKGLTKLSKLAPHNNDYLSLRHQHRERVDRLVHVMTAQGNSLYRQEKIAEAKFIWENALKFDRNNKTLQTQIRRADKVLLKLQELRNKRSAVRQ